MKRTFFAFLTLCYTSLSALSPALQEVLDLFGIDIENVQERWMQKGKERWEFDKRYEFMRPVAWPLFEKAGLVLEVSPQKDHYDYAIVYGALLAAVEKRIAYLADLWKKGVRFEQIVFLTGERTLLDSEKTICLLEMESQMVEWAYLRSDLPKDVPVVFINAFQKLRDGKSVRPQTIDTIVAWLETAPHPGNCLAVSNQPYVPYQMAVMQSILPKEFDLETVGPCIQGEPTVALILDTIAKTIANSRGSCKTLPSRKLDDFEACFGGSASRSSSTDGGLPSAL